MDTSTENFISLKKISLKENSDINEALIQEYIFNHPEQLGLEGNIDGITREKILPYGGRLDILLGNGDIRYEVEVQLGKTDTEHIIRTLEYWDLERKRYPNYDHCAVIIAEEITNRFMNVISLFNGNMPIIAIQLSAYEVDGKIALVFTKVLDRINTINDDEDDENEITDEKFWINNRSTKGIIDYVKIIAEDIFKELNLNGYQLKYNKHYIGITRKGRARNFFIFKPNKSVITFCIKNTDKEEIKDLLTKNQFSFTFYSGWKEYDFPLRTPDCSDALKVYQNKKQVLLQLLNESKNYYNIPLDEE